MVISRTNGGFIIEFLPDPQPEYEEKIKKQLGLS